FNLTVNNVAPTITSYNVPSSGYVGSLVSLSAAATDPGGGNDPLTYTWTVIRPDSTSFTLTGPNAAFTPSGYGSYGASLTVTDGDGGSASLPSYAGLVSWWRGEGNTNDFAGVNNGFTYGTVTYTAGRVGQAFSFNGSFAVGAGGGQVQVSDSP